MAKKKTFVQKLRDNTDLPSIVKLDEKGQKRFDGDTMVIVHPTEIYAIMARIPEGKLITTTEIREYLAKKHEASTTCPLTTGIFMNIAANASLELGEDVPFWRTLRNKGELNPKYPGGEAAQIEKLRAEGFHIGEKGRKNIKYFVKDYENYLTDLNDLQIDE